MENRGLLFIPDISGFTRFINQSEIEHSRLIIQELLELLINANEIGLEVSEVEGDAILFYKYGDAPDLPTISKQVKRMFCEFHRHLINYENRRICQCEACKTTVDLTLKVISHYGEFTDYNVKNFRKLIGKDVIVAHQLLKNDIDQHEYWMVTDNLAKTNQSTPLPDWVMWNNSGKHTESGKVDFQYTQLTALKNELPEAPELGLEIPNKVKVISLSQEFNTDMQSLLFTLLDFGLRGSWQVGVRATDQVSHVIPQVGTSHRCILEKGQQIVYTSSFSFEPQQVIYSETDEKKQFAIYVTIEKRSEKKSHLTLDFYLKKSFFMNTMFKLFMKKKMEKQFRQSFVNLENVISKAPTPVVA